jgi:hypothetical protein
MTRKTLSLLALLMLVLVACSPASASTGAANPTRLQVTRTGAFPEYGFAPLFVVVQDVTTVQHLYQAAYALPSPPSGPVNCPNDIGLVYHLDFFQGDASVQQMDLDATGCQVLHITPDDARMSNDAFRESLQKALGIPSLVPPIPGRNQP